jgi:enterochelin esterase-like enzyme
LSIDGLGIQLLGVASVVAGAIALSLTWDRSRWVLRSALATLSALILVTTALLALNRITETYTSWSALAGTSPAAAEDSGSGGSGGSDTSAPAAGAAPAAGRSSVIQVDVKGPLSGMNLPMFVYLPAVYAQQPGTRFPVIEVTDGFPGSPHTWINRLGLQSYLDREIGAGRMAPAVVLLPYQTPDQLRDTECTDLAHGAKAETYLTRDVPAYAEAHFHIRTDRAGWGLIGYSAGGFCSVNLVLKHPGRFAAGASLSGYGEPGITVGDGSERTTNNDDWRLTHLPQPAVSLYLAFAADDPATKRESLRLAARAHFPVQVTTAVVAHGGHTMVAWKAMEPAAFDWLSAHLARPQP